MLSEQFWSLRKDVMTVRHADIVTGIWEQQVGALALTTCIRAAARTASGVPFEHAGASARRLHFKSPTGFSHVAHAGATDTVAIRRGAFLVLRASAYNFGSPGNGQLRPPLPPPSMA